VDLTTSARAVIPTRDADVLLVLAGTTLPLTGRQVFRIAGSGSRSGVQIALIRLEKQGLVDVQEAGSANLYTLNSDHVAAAAVLALVDLRGQLVRRISEQMAKWRIRPVAAAVFGSAARGDGGTESDIDLFVVRPEKVLDDDPDWGSDVAELSVLIRRWSGNSASIIQATPSQVTSMQARKEPIVESLRRDARSLIGPNILAATEVVE
jgi:DNA-binding transcriptional ArsR family regulator